MSVYNKKFYDNQEKGSLNSAREILPYVMEIINPKSVIDVGCGLGTWLSVFKELGVDNILGLDGEWVNKNRLLIPGKNFIETDLENPKKLNREFDLAISLEVAEHLSEEKAENFINYLTKKAPVILFSASIPFQGGTNHINEQWPEYWIKLFNNNNYIVIDCIRSKIWCNNNIEWWYIQNIFLFVDKNYLKNNKKLRELKKNYTHSFPLVHPKLYSKKIKEIEKSKEDMNVNIKDYEKKIAIQKYQYSTELAEFNKICEIQNKHVQKLDSKIKKYEEEIIDTINRLDYYQNSIICMEKKKKLKNSRIKSLEKDLEYIKNEIKNIANTKPYRIAYFLRRFSHEFMNGNKKSFLLWIYCKLLRKESGLEFKYNPLMKLSKKKL